MVRKVKVSASGREVLTLMRASAGPLTVADLAVQLFSKHEGFDGDSAEKKKAIGRVSREVGVLHKRGFVWRVLPGYWWHVAPDVGDKFLAWVNVTCDMLMERPTDERHRRIEALQKFLAHYGSGDSTAVGADQLTVLGKDAQPIYFDLELMRATMVQALASLLEIGGRSEAYQTAECALVDRAVVEGLDKNKWLEGDDIVKLIPDVVNYIKRTADLPHRVSSSYSRAISVGFIARLADRCGHAVVFSLNKKENGAITSEWLSDFECQSRNARKWAGRLVTREKTE